MTGIQCLLIIEKQKGYTSKTKKKTKQKKMVLECFSMKINKHSAMLYSEAEIMNFSRCEIQYLTVQSS